MTQTFDELTAPNKTLPSTPRWDLRFISGLIGAGSLIRSVRHNQHESVA